MSCSGRGTTADPCLTYSVCRCWQAALMCLMRRLMPARQQQNSGSSSRNAPGQAMSRNAPGQAMSSSISSALSGSSHSTTWQQRHAGSGAASAGSSSSSKQMPQGLSWTRMLRSWWDQGARAATFTECGRSCTSIPSLLLA